MHAYLLSGRSTEGGFVVIAAALRSIKLNSHDSDPNNSQSAMRLCLETNNDLKLCVLLTHALASSFNFILTGTSSRGRAVSKSLGKGTPQMVCKVLTWVRAWRIRGRGMVLSKCQFGKQAKELGSTWFADLGPPFGVMYCIKCECIPVQKKRRVVAKVQCRNIKNECPEPSCDSPVLLPGRCCKACPGDVNFQQLASRWHWLYRRYCACVIPLVAPQSGVSCLLRVSALGHLLKKNPA
ncbi:Dorsal-ventral patterning protein Sog [Eumeta japonica]|uniref:Dorsal-ventral patterning protein Sog n=1 Tax=Eumeta variegata TaxID=151549 RepID=A0A4C1U9S3_EUMVA|nr:Dorsal-ventral patterning protein Sog [Eumeta japonica]